MLTKTEIGQPVRLLNPLHISVNDGVYGRIVEYVNGSAKANGLTALVRIATPHGSIIETGIFYLEEITGDTLEKLIQYEQMAMNANVTPYAGKYTLKTENQT